MRPPFSYLPALPCAAGLVLGIICENIGFAWVAAGIATTAFIILYRLRAHYIAFFALTTVLGILLAFASTPSKLPPSLIDKECIFSAKVLNVVEKSASTQCIMEIDSCNGKPIPHLKTITYLLDYSPTLQAGCRIKIRSALLPIENKKSIIPHEVDYEQMLRFQGIVCKATLKKSDGQGILYYGESIKVTHPPHGLSLIINNVRKSIFNAIVDAPISQESASFLLAVILGDDLYLSPEMLEGFRATGISHLLALSGLHVGVIASLISLLLFPFRLSQRLRVFQTFLTLMLVWAYTIIVGMGASVLRSAIMISVFACSALLQRSSNPYNSIFVAVVIILTLNPYSLFTPGFQMSFMAVFSILLFTRAIPSELKKRIVLSTIIQVLLVPIAAMLGTGLIGAYYFHTIPWLFLFANVIAGILFPWILSGGFILIGLNLCSIRIDMIGKLVDVLIDLLDESTSWFASFGAKSDNLFFDGWVLLPTVVGTIFLAFLLRKLFKSEVMPYPLPSLSFLLTGCFSSFLIAILIILGLKESVPFSEMYIPTGSPSTLMIKVDKNIWVIPLDNGIDTVKLKYDYQKRFINYFRSRSCKNLRFVTDSISNEFLSYKNNTLIYRGNSFAILNNPSSLKYNKVNYAIISKGFKGSAATIIDYINPDTVLFTKSFNGNSRRKLERELSPLPCKTLGKNTFAF